MGKRLRGLGRMFIRHRYLCVTVLFVAVAGFLDTNSFWARYRLHEENEALREEIRQYEQRYERDTRELDNLKHSQAAVERVARLRLFMKTADEDVYVFED